MAQAMYAVYKFRHTGSTQINDPAFVTVDPQAAFVPEAQADAAKLAVFKIGESTIVPIRMDRHMVAEGYRVTRIPDFSPGVVLFDNQAKEWVKVSNGRCVLDHGSTEGFAAAHRGGPCVYAPSEAVALRPFISEMGEISVAWTYRGVDATQLSVPTDRAKAEKQFERALNPPDRKQRKPVIGRI